MCEFVEDGQGLMPGFVCGGGVAIAVVEVAEAGEGNSFEVVVAEFAPQCDRTLVVGDGLTKVSVAVGGVAEAFQGAGLADLVAKGAEQVQRLAAVDR